MLTHTNLSKHDHIQCDDQLHGSSKCFISLPEIHGSESFNLRVEMKERIQPKWFAGLHTKVTEVLTPVSVVNLIDHPNHNADVQ